MQHRQRNHIRDPLDYGCERSTTPTPPRPKINAPSRQTRPWRLKRKFVPTSRVNSCSMTHEVVYSSIVAPTIEIEEDDDRVMYVAENGDAEYRAGAVDRAQRAVEEPLG